MEQKKHFSCHIGLNTPRLIDLRFKENRTPAEQEEVDDAFAVHNYLKTQNGISISKADFDRLEATASNSEKVKLIASIIYRSR